YEDRNSRRILAEEGEPEKYITQAEDGRVSDTTFDRGRTARKDPRTRGARTRRRGCARVRRLEKLLDRLSHVGRTLDHLHARGGERSHLLGGSTLSARDDGARMTHAAPGRRGLSGNEADDGLLDLLLDPGGGIFLGAAADFADHDYRVGLRILAEQLQRVDVRRADQRIAADADARALPHPEARELMDRLVRQRAALG